MIPELGERAKTILRMVVESYLETGQPVGSRTLSRFSGLDLSPASIRNVMQDLEESGFLSSPHTSAGRMPTQFGLRLYVDGLMSIGSLSDDEKNTIETRCASSGRVVKDVYEQAGNMLSGLSSCASLVISPKTEKPIKQINFVDLSHGRVLIVIVTSDGLVENRYVEFSSNIPQSSLQMAENYLNEKLRGKTLAEARKGIISEIEQHKAQLDNLTANLIKRGVNVELTGSESKGHILVRGTSRLLSDVRAMQELEDARNLLEALENQENVLGLLEMAQDAQGVQVFIGTETRFFNSSGCSVVLSPVFKRDETGKEDMSEKVIGAVGVIGPTRINYGRIVPMVDYTSQVIGRLLGYDD